MKSKSFNYFHYNVIHVIREIEDRYKVLILFLQRSYGIILYIKELLNVLERKEVDTKHCNKYVKQDQFGFTSTCYAVNDMYFNSADDNVV